MKLKSSSTALAELQFEHENNFSLGIRELLFLGTILSIGFCGFTVCVDKIYSVSLESNQIESITVHDNDLSAVHQTANPSLYSGYSLSIEN